MSDETNLPAKIYPCDAAARGRILAALENGVTIGQLSRGSAVNRAIVSQYCSPAGNQYAGVASTYETRMLHWLDKRDLEFLAGVATIQTAVTKKIQDLLRATRQMRVIGRGIGESGIGKTRGASYLESADSTVMVYFVSQECGTREALRSGLFIKFGIRGGSKTYGSSNLDKYRELVKRVRDADVAFIFDQAHMLSLPAMHFLCELWNETRRAQLWLGTEKLLDKLERDPQIASRVEFGDLLTFKKESLRTVIQHQIKSILPSVNGELAQLTGLCETLASSGALRRVEMRLGNMLYLSEKEAMAGKSWCELFELAELSSQ